MTDSRQRKAERAGSSDACDDPRRLASGHRGEQTERPNNREDTVAEWNREGQAISAEPRQAVPRVESSSTIPEHFDAITDYRTALFRPPHGGYPTPMYDEAPMRRRLDSLRLFGHSGAITYGTSRRTMRLAGEGVRGNISEREA